MSLLKNWVDLATRRSSQEFLDQRKKVMAKLKLKSS